MNPEWTCDMSTPVSHAEAIDFLREFLSTSAPCDATEDLRTQLDANSGGPKGRSISEAQGERRKYTPADTSRLLKGMKAELRAQQAEDS
jgi:hypothetical protein